MRPFPSLLQQPHHKMLIAGFANSDLNQEQLSKLGTLLSEIYGEKIKNDA